MEPRSETRRPTLLSLALICALLAGAGGSLLGACGPFTDVAADAFCPFILEIFYLGITTGTTPTTFDPASSVSRTQMSAFLARTVDGALKRGSRRAALNQLWTTQTSTVLGVLGMTTVSPIPLFVQSDGADLWVTNSSATVNRVRGSDGRQLETWTGATAGSGVIVALSRVFVTGLANKLYEIDPSKAAGVVTTVATNLGVNATSIAFDGARFFTANAGFPAGTVSIISPAAAIPWAVTTISVGASPTTPQGILHDGSNVWVTDSGQGTLLKLSGNGTVLQTVTIGGNPTHPVFDGTNIWVPNNSQDSVTVVRSSSGAILKTLTGNGLSSPIQAAFDGERVLVSDEFSDEVSLWKAADLTPLGSFSTGTGTGPHGVCSDGIRFWIALSTADKLARF